MPTTSPYASLYASLGLDPAGNKTNNTPTVSSASPYASLYSDLGLSPTGQKTKIDIAREQAQTAEQNAQQAGSFGGMVKNTISAIPDNSAIIGSVKNLYQAGKNAFSAAQSGSFPKVVASAINLPVAAVGVAFSPIAEANQAAQKVPVLKQAADVLNFPFEVTGMVGGSLAKGFINAIPDSVMSPETKDTLRPAFEALGSTAGQVFLGGKILSELGKGKTIDKTVVDNAVQEAKTIPETPKEVTPTPPVAETPPQPTIPKELQPLAQETQKYKSAEDFVKAQTPEYARKAVDSNGYYTEKRFPDSAYAKTFIANNDIPDTVIKKGDSVAIIKDGNRYSAVLAEEKVSPENGYRITQENNINPNDFTSKSQLTDFYNQVTAKPTEVQVSRTQLPVGTGETKVSGLEARIKDKLGALTPEEQQGISTYQQMNKTDQIKKAVDYVTKNPEDALAVLKGDKVAPKGLLNNSIFLAMEEQAHGDTALALKLASLRSTRAGQEISILTERDPNSPVRYLTDLTNAKIEAVGREKLATMKKTELDTTAKVIRKSNLAKTDWNSFIDSISC